MKKKVRYPLLKLGMVIGIVIAYFSFVFAGKMVREEYLESQDVENYQNEENTIGVGLRYEGEGNDILHTMDDERVTGYISAIPLYANTEENVCLMNVYLHVPEVFPYPVQDGIVPTRDQLADKEPVIVLGQGLKSDVIQKEKGDYYIVCGEEYRVIAYLAATESSSLDYVRILFYDCLGEKTKSDIDYFAFTQGLTLVFRSDTVDLIDYYRKKQKQVDDKVIDISYSQGFFEDSYAVDNDLIDYQKYAYLLYIFSLVLIVMVIELWIIQRRKEFAIRRAVGYSRYQIIGMISQELIKTIFGIGVFLLLVQLVFQKLFLRGMETGLLNDLVLCLFFIVFTFVLLMIYPIYKIMTDSIAASIQNKGV
ncbi:MAG: ABC transporter permease [Lachnospiraceae bacterium]|nr:ABC transporter permease [Lachnospiraceae bacterium]